MSAPSPLRLALLASKAKMLGITLEELLARGAAEQAVIDRNRRHRELAVDLGDNTACRAILARNALARGRAFVLASMALALLLLGCVEHGRGTTAREALDLFAPAICERMQRCQPASFPFDSLAMCERDVVEDACAAGECDVPFAGTEDDLAACIDTFEQFPCVATVLPPNCLEVG